MNEKAHNSYIKFTTIGFQMLATIGLFSFTGWWLDCKYSNNYSAYTAVFSLLGVFIAIYQVVKQVIAMSKDQ